MIYKLTNRTFKVTDISTLNETLYEGMNKCSIATGITKYKLRQIAEDIEEKDWYITTTKGKMYKVRCYAEPLEPLIIAVPVIPDLFAPIKFRSVTKAVQQFGISKFTIYDRWSKAFPIYEDNPTELITRYWQNNTPVTCKSGNAYGEKFILRFYKAYDSSSNSFEEHKGFKNI